MGAFISDVEFPISDGVVVAALRAGLIAKGWGSGLTVARKLPDTKTRRMVTVRNDSGPQDEGVSRRRYGFNFWADDSSDAENMALDGMSVLRLLPGGIVAATDGFSGPFEVEDDPQYVVAGKNLFHQYATCRVSIRGNKPV